MYVIALMHRLLTLAWLAGCAGAASRPPASPQPQPLAAPNGETPAIDGGPAPVEAAAIDTNATPTDARALRPAASSPASQSQVASPTSPDPGPLAAKPPRSAKSAKGLHRLTVHLRGTGSLTGHVVSTPPGVDCEIVTGQNDTNVFGENHCEAKLPAGPVTLTFTSTGAAYFAQFSLQPGHHICPGAGVAGGDAARGRKSTCSFTLDRAMQVDMSSISVPPFPPAPAPPRH